MANEKQQKKKDQKKKPSQDSSGVRTFYLVLGTVAVLGVGALAYSVGSQAFSSATTEPVDLGEVDDTTLIRLAQPVERGDPDAPVTIIEFADYQCPACRQFATNYGPLVKLNFIDSGQAKLTFYDFPLIQTHPNAFVAARAARCAGDQDAYWQYHDALFSASKHRDWTGESNPVGRFVAYAGELGLDRDEFESCVKSDRHADVVTANRQLAMRLNVSGTPTIMVAREGQRMAQRLPSFDFATIQEAVQAALAEQ